MKFKAQSSKSKRSSKIKVPRAVVGAASRWERGQPCPRGPGGDSDSREQGRPRLGGWLFFGPALLELQRLFDCHLPEGDLRIAHSFKGGKVEWEHRVPKGRLNHCHNDENVKRHLTYAGFSRPFGTCPMAELKPAVDCRAILKSPSGREETPTQIGQTPERGQGCPHSCSRRSTTPPRAAARWNLILGLWSFLWILSFEPGASAAPRTPWTSNRVTGSPNPPAPYTVERVFPQLTFNNPLDLTFAPGTDRLFIAEQGGKLWSLDARSTNTRRFSRLK